MKISSITLITYVLCYAIIWYDQAIAFSFSPPKKLSDWNIFYWDQQKNSFILNPLHFPYKLKSSLFSDYALKYRTLFIPKGKITIKGDKLIFPNGTLLSKTFSYGPYDIEINGNLLKPELLISGPFGENHFVIETRILYKQNNLWYAFPYVWNSIKKDATLKVEGKKIKLYHYKAKKNFSYIVPKMNQCLICHANHKSNKKIIKPIGAQEAGLMDIFIGKRQLDQIIERDRLDSTIYKKKGKLQWVDYEDENINLNKRARSYLAINCAHCHSSTGAASHSNLFLGLDIQKKKQLGICKKPVAVGRGSGGRPFSISPGSFSKSIIPYRMKSTLPGIKMPEMGRSLPHTEGIEIISNWILEMKEEEC